MNKENPLIKKVFKETKRMLSTWTIFHLLFTYWYKKKKKKLITRNVGTREKSNIIHYVLSTKALSFLLSFEAKIYKEMKNFHPIEWHVFIFPPNHSIYFFKQSYRNFEGRVKSSRHAWVTSSHDARRSNKPRERKFFNYSACFIKIRWILPFEFKIISKPLNNSYQGRSRISWIVRWSKADFE